MERYTMTVDALRWVYRGGGVQSIPAKVLDELGKHGVVIGNVPGRIDEQIMVKHWDESGGWFLGPGDAIVVVPDAPRGRKLHIHYGAARGDAP